MSIIAGIDSDCIKNVLRHKSGVFRIGIMHAFTFVSMDIALDDIEAAKQRALDHMRIGLVHGGRKAATDQDLLDALAIAERIGERDTAPILREAIGRGILPDPDTGAVDEANIEIRAIRARLAALAKQLNAVQAEIAGEKAELQRVMTRRSTLHAGLVGRRLA